MNKLENNQIKTILLDTLAMIDDFCVQNNLRYFLCGGSCLGAIRHGGFIPWDDDIDIAMPRQDYDIFVQSFKAKDLKVFCYRKDKHYFMPFAKVSNLKTILKEKRKTH